MCYQAQLPIAHPTSFFFSFEGIDGCGKSTQLQLLAAFLRQRGKTVHSLREPGGTGFGEQLRGVILAVQEPLHPLAEAHLFAAARAQLLQEKILPLLALPQQVVLLDRYVDSSVVYQGYGRQLGAETIWQLHQHPPLNIVPHITFYLEISLAVALERRRQRANACDYFEQHDPLFFQRLITGYQSLASSDPARIKTIAGDGPIEQVFAQLQTCLPANYYA